MKQDNMGKPWTKEEMLTLYNLKTSMPIRTYEAIASLLGRTADSVRNKWRKTSWEKEGFIPEPHVSENIYLRDEYYDKAVTLFDKRVSRADAKIQLIADAFEKSINKLPEIPLSVYQKNFKENKKHLHSEDVGLILSDLHIGHQHTLEDTGGISEYNNDIFFKRIKNLQYALKEIVELHSHLYKLPTLHIFCLGDIVAGMNDTGAWSPLFIADPIVDQTINGFQAISELITYALGMFEEIHFYGVGGNHGRTSKQNVQKDKDNWDYVSYKFLEVMFANNPRVKFNISKSWWINTEIRNKNFLLVHGDYSGNGLPLNALQKFEQKMGGILKNNPDYTLAGHFHNACEYSTNRGKILINGSFVGSDVYSLRNVHAASQPEQKVFGIGDKHGITWSYNINLDIERKTNATS